MATALEGIRHLARRLEGRPSDYDALLDQVGDRSLVLLGEASHGTHDFYRRRAEITQRLIEEKGFEAVAVEADWPDALRLTRYVKGESGDSLDAAFGDFERFPRWMWRNHEVREFIAWLCEHNASRPLEQRVGFHGLDLYSLYRSAEAVIAYLDEVDPDQAARARVHYACLDHGGDPIRYGQEAALGLSQSCQDEAVSLLADLLELGDDDLRRDGLLAVDEQFYAEQNARVVINAEAYYRAMFGSRLDTWNLRDEHMTDTLVELRAHLRRQGGQGKVVVWAHNSHLGDARATEMGQQRGQHNIGQLVRQRFGQDDSLLVGFTTHSGHVAAAHDWDGNVQQRWVRPSLEGSVERLFHDSGLGDFYLPLESDAAELLAAPLLERAIGVIYRPETERASHYFRARVASQFDAIFHLDETSSVEPLDKDEPWNRKEVPETYPFGL
ncbi:erythromycin esterase family protein [Halomonas daqiaonensis]|uniref:Erythromycin esterase homolog n=1 Tax=Halomonas daqiaonensis TaxID=650850 RepID=A0A1H7U127_9GAMM|nr:erythromycin esterase family protein [Halomonas daqiaonensis]SEL90643.1 Erythromycin esterase homolog [Halomonas daqiaonensis]